MKTILSIVPRLPPTIDGVGDYGSLLARALESHSILTQFIVCDPLQPVDSSSRLKPIQLSERSHELLLAVLNSCEIDTLLLHYVGYGYAKRGCPQWLVDALLEWKQGKASRKIATMFHEVYASSNQPWSSQFWTSSTQKKIARDLMDLSDIVLTSTQVYADIITKLNSKYDGKVHVLPIFSNIGECCFPRLLEQRNPWLVTFGNTKLRSAIYTKSLEQVITICHQLEIEEIYDIGHKFNKITSLIPQVKVNDMGILTASEISDIFRMARVGFLNYPVAYIAKSGIFAAYVSHGLFPVVDRSNIENNLDGIVIEKHYWALQKHEDVIDLVTAQEIANNAYNWYINHNIQQTSNRLAYLLGQF